MDPPRLSSNLTKRPKRMGEGSGQVVKKGKTSSSVTIPLMGVLVALLLTSYQNCNQAFPTNQINLALSSSSLGTTSPQSSNPSNQSSPTPAPPSGRVITANPSNLASLLTTLQPGDTLALTAGTYAPFTINNLNGSSSNWIAITGPSSGPPAIIQATTDCCNIIEIVNSSYVAIENLVIDGGSNVGLDGPFGISANGDTSNLVHNILLQANTFRNLSGDQQNDAISTKIPTWGWIIRQNKILDAGTGIYLGNSDGSDPFVDGIIEDNLIENPIGYDMEIKFQNPRPSVTSMPASPQMTIIRNNVFIKNDQPSPDGDRPNILVGGFPSSGPGSSDMYEVYGNVFDHNPRESLFQFSGRVSVHDNIFVDGGYEGIAAKDQDLPLAIAYIYNNTFYSMPSGIVFGNSAALDDGVIGNIIFADTPISGPIVDLSDNITGATVTASNYLTQPSTIMGSMNFFPLANGKCMGATLDLSKFASDVDSSLDFNRNPKDSATFRGAYAGQGTNPGWSIQVAIKP